MVNTISILVHPPDFTGSVPPEGGQGGDHFLARRYLLRMTHTQNVFALHIEMNRLLEMKYVNYTYELLQKKAT